MKKTFLLYLIFHIGLNLSAQHPYAYHVKSFNGIYIDKALYNNYHLLYNGQFVFFYLNKQNNVDPELVGSGNFGFYSSEIDADQSAKMKPRRWGTVDDNIEFIFPSGATVVYVFDKRPRELNLFLDENERFLNAKIYVLSKKIVSQLRVIANQKHIEIEKFLYSIETIGKYKAKIYSLPGVPTKMYLIKVIKSKLLSKITTG